MMKRKSGSGFNAGAEKLLTVPVTHVGGYSKVAGQRPILSVGRADRAPEGNRENDKDSARQSAFDQRGRNPR